ncbi:MAG: outer membrane protein assembly factor BamA, partial [Deltaproteobacteria bacterium]|nr:outer membrane protein assembly factor BamA [Deltaproteobacteria bacterium]
MKRNRSLFFIFVSACFIYSWALFASALSVTSIEVKGNTATPLETILATIKMKKGDTFSREKVQGDVKALWNLGLFKDITIDKDETGGGIKLTYAVVEKPIITKFSFKGNKKLKKDDLEKDVTLHTYKPLSEKAIAESMAKMREAYAKKGYYLAGIDYHLESLEGNEVELVFDISEHQMTVVRKIEFVGNHAYKDKELRKIIKTKEKKAFSWLTGSGKYKEDQLEHDVMLLTFHYLNNGYL